MEKTYANHCQEWQIYCLKRWSYLCEQSNLPEFRIDGEHIHLNGGEYHRKKVKQGVALEEYVKFSWCKTFRDFTDEEKEEHPRQDNGDEVKVQCGIDTVLTCGRTSMHPQHERNYGGEIAWYIGQGSD